MADHRNMPVEDLIRSQLQSEEEFTDQRSSHFKLCIAKITVEKDLPQALTCHLARLRLSSSSFTWLKGKINNHARQTLKINCHL